MKNDIIYRLILHPKMTSVTKHSIVQFSYNGGIVRCPKRLGVKILASIAKRRYKLTRELIDIYSDLFVTNLS